MRRLFGAAAVSLVASLAMGQSLGEIAKREKERRKRNQERGTEVRGLTQADLARVRPAESPPAEAAEAPSTEGDAETIPVPPPSIVQPPTEPPPLPPSPASLVPAPSFSLPDRNGRSVSLAEFRGQAVLLDFWATWCGPCRGTMPEIERLHNQYRAKGLQVIGINIEGRKKDVLDYLDEAGYSFLVVFDAGGWGADTAKRYQVSSIPRTFLIDRAGNVVFSGHPGSLTEPLIERTLQ